MKRFTNLAIKKHLKIPLMKNVQWFWLRTLKLMNSQKQLFG